MRDWGDAETEIGQLGTDVLITAATDNIVPDNVLSLFPCRAVNFHGSLLPHYRGPNPYGGDGSGWGGRNLWRNDNALPFNRNR